MPRDRRRQPRESLDGFLFNVEKFFGSVPCQRMSFSEKGVYLVMLFQQWRAGSLPDDPHAVAELIAITDSQAADVIAAWPVIRRKFVTHEHDPKWIVNIALEETRRKQRRYLKSRAEAGRLGGEAKARNSRTVTQLEDVAQLQQNVAEPQLSQRELQQNVAIRVEKRGVEKKDRRGHEIASATSPSVLTFPTIGPVAEWALTEDQLREWTGLYPGLDVAAEARHALAWVQASGPHRKTARGMPSFLVNWFNRSVKSGGTRRGSPAPDGLSDTARFNLTAQEEAQRIIEANELARTGTNGHRR